MRGLRWSIAKPRHRIWRLCWPLRINLRDNEFMAILPYVYTNPAQLDSGIQRAAQALAPDVVRIRYNLDDDWTGDPSVFFRIVISDEAVRARRLAETAERIMDGIGKEVRPEELGIHAYYNFASLSEVTKAPNPAWM